jgi:hypothetical protein
VVSVLPYSDLTSDKQPSSYRLDNLEEVVCKTMVMKDFPTCEHSAEMECSSDPSEILCTSLCAGTMTCCGRPCNSRCHSCKEVNAPAEGKIVRVQHCRHPCKKLLFCAHRCSNICSQDHKCATTCKEQCRQECSHSRCNAYCSTLCTPCMKECTWYVSSTAWYGGLTSVSGPAPTTSVPFPVDRQGFLVFCSNTVNDSTP